MKLALIRQRYNAFGGAERFIERAMRALSAEGSVTVTLIARDWNRDPDGAAQLRRCNPFYLGRTWRDWSFARAACAIASGGQYDLVQSHERIACCDIYRAGDGVHAQWLANRSRTLGPLRRFVQTASPWHRYTLAAERRLFASPRLKAVVCNSKMVAGELRSHFGLSDKVRVIHNGVDLARFHPGLRAQWRDVIRKRLGISQGAIVHLFLGSGFERKGVAALLAAYAGIRDQRDRHLMIVGADRHASAFKARSRALGLADRVHFPGAQADPGPWYAAADGFVLPTLYDPFPNAVLEAMACGLPPITSTQSGAAELISAGINGFVCDALDVPALTHHLIALNHDAATRMGTAARAVAEQYSLEIMAEKLVGLYRELLEARAPA